VFNALVRDCGTLWARHGTDLPNYSDTTNNNKFRYLSFYDNNTANSAYNHIVGGVNTFSVDDDYDTLSGCNDNEPGGRLENWGYATDKIINSYNWLPDYQRVVIPVSDEYAWCGGDVSIINPADNENNISSDSTADILVNIINSANAVSPNVFVSPVILAGANNIVTARQVADATGGYLSTTADASAWNTNLNLIIGGVFCDGREPWGVMDCTLPGGSAAAGFPSLSLPSYSIATDSLARTLSTIVTIGGTASWWDAVANDAWITNITKTGNTLSYNVAANTGTARWGSITVTAGGTTGSPIAVTLSINQESVLPPSVSLSPSSFSRDSNAATLNTTVTLGGSAISWSAVSDFPAWLSGVNQVGNILSFNLAANTGPIRTGTITVTASSATGVTATTTLSITQAAPVIPPDTTPPTDPGNTLVATALDGQIRLDWAASTDASGIVRYEVERISPNPFIFTSNFNTFTNTGLTNGVTYTYRVRAYDAASPANYSSYSNTVSATPVPAAVPPRAPISLTATPQASGVYLTWGVAATGDPVSYFRLERSTNFSFSSFTVVADINFASFTGNYTDAFPLANPTVTYYYRVKSVNSSSGLESVYAGPVDATIPDTSPPTIPTNLTATLLGGLQFRLSWTNSTDNIGIDHYQVQYKPDAFVSDGTGVTIGNPTTNSIDYTVAASSVTNSFRVQAFDIAGNASGWQIPANVGIFSTPDTIAPTTPTLTATASSNNVNLSWTVSSDNVAVTGYELLRANVSGGPYTLVVCPSSSCSVTGATARRNTTVPDGTYYYVVQAFDAAGNRSNNSNEAMVLVDAGIPTKPTISNIIVPSGQVGFDINSTGGLEPRTFTIERSHISDPTNFIVRATIPAAPIGATSYTDSPVSGGTTYYYRVTCTSGDGKTSEYSDIATANTADTTPPTAPVPLNFTAVPSTLVAGDIILSWNAFTDPSGIRGYTLERQINGGVWERLPSIGSEITTTNTNYTDSVGTPTSLTTYNYRLRAVDDSIWRNITSWSNVSTFACNAAYCDQWDAGTGVAPGSWAACSGSCSTAPQRCCQACRDTAGNYSGCRLNSSRPNSCPIPTATDVICR